MALKFRLKGLAETFVNEVTCPCCGTGVSNNKDNQLKTEYTKVTLSGIVVVVRCASCEHVFIPSGQKFGVINHSKLSDAVAKDSENTGQPIFKDVSSVLQEVERLNAAKDSKFH